MADPPQSARAHERTLQKAGVSACEGLQSALFEVEKQLHSGAGNSEILRAWNDADGVVTQAEATLRIVGSQPIGELLAQLLQQAHVQLAEISHNVRRNTHAVNAAQEVKADDDAGSRREQRVARTRRRG